MPELPNAFWEGEEVTAIKLSARLIVATQSCDLVETQTPTSIVTLCRVYTINEFDPGEWTTPKKKKWEKIRQGKVNQLHLLGPITTPDNPHDALVADFRQIITLPRDYLASHARLLGERYRLLSPYREHFSQAYARYYMRVGLPSDIPRFT